MSDDFEEQFAAELVGSYVLAGVTRVDHSGNVLSRTQFHGRVISASAADGVVIGDANGEEHRLPPHRRAFIVADPGEYHLKPSGEVVIDPDYITTWTVHPPDRH